MATNNATNNLLAWPFVPGFVENSAAGLFVLPGTYSTTLVSSILTPADGTNLNSNMVFMPICCINGFTSSVALLSVAVPLASSSVNIALYASDPTNSFPAVSASALAGCNIVTTASGVKNSTLTFTFKPNTLYWVGIQTSSAVTLSLNSAALNIMNYGPGINISNTSGGTLYGKVNSFVASTFPTTPTTSGGYAIPNMVNFPIIMFE